VVIRDDVAPALHVKDGGFVDVIVSRVHARFAGMA
jgi:hypothetical protein